MQITKKFFFVKKYKAVKFYTALKMQVKSILEISWPYAIYKDIITF